jgi:hypothetical protein
MKPHLINIKNIFCGHPNKIYHSCEQVEPQTLYNIVKPFKRQAKYLKFLVFSNQKTLDFENPGFSALLKLFPIS